MTSRTYNMSGCIREDEHLEIDALKGKPDVSILMLVVRVHIAADAAAEQDGLLRDRCDAAAHILR